MVESIMDWANKKTIPIMRSKGSKGRPGRICVCDYYENLVIPYGAVWPHPDIIKKIVKSRHTKDFSQEAINELSKQLGFYSDIQSLASEDAITWSVFGSIQCYPKLQQVEFINSLLDLMNKPFHIRDCHIELWTRIAHPERLNPGGPELDIIIIADRCVIFGEAKWGASISIRQGINQDKNQLTLRLDYFNKYGIRIFPNAEDKILLLIGIEEKKPEITCSYLTWENICKQTNHPLRDKLVKYYEWKIKHGAKI